MADVQAWANQIAQQLFDGPQDLANEAAANVTDASGLAFFVGKPNGSSGQWTLKKLTPTELGKLVYNYLTTQSIAQQLASVLGGLNFLGDLSLEAADNVKTTSWYYVWSNSNGLQPVITVAQPNGVRGFQLYIREKAHIDYRYMWKDSWTSWVTLV